MARIPESQVEQAILEGSFAFKPGTQVTVKDASGGVFEVPAEEVKEALDQGYKIETSQDRAVREYVAENDNLKGQTKVALGQFADEAALGIPELAFDKTQSPLDVKKKDALKKHFEAANDIGGVLGFGTSLLVGGPLFKTATKAGVAAEKAVATQLAAKGIERGSKSLAKDIVARTAENATRLGVEGAVVSAPHALTEAALGDPEAAAETLFANGGIGMALGAVGGPLSRGLEGVASKLSKSNASQFLGELSDERAAKALGFSKGQIKKLKGGQKEAEEIGNYLMDAKLAGGEAVISPTASADDIYDKVLRLRGEAGGKIGKVYEQLDAAGVPNERLLNLETVLKDAANKDFKGNIFAGERKIMEDIIGDIQGLRGGPGMGPLRDGIERREGSIALSDVKGYMDRLADIAFPKGLNLEPTPRQAVARKAWGLLRGEVDAAVDAAVAKTGDDALRTTLDVARKDYSMTSKAKRALEDKISSMAGNKLIGLTDTIAGVGAAAVDPLTLIPTILAKKTFEKYGNATGAHLFRQASDGILMAEKFLDRAKSRLDEIPTFVKSSGPKASISSESLGAISRLLEEHEEGKSRNKAVQFQKLQEVVSNTVSNTEAAVASLSNRMQALENGGAAETSKALATQMVRSTQYLYDAMPKQPYNSGPFAPYKYQPSDAELAAFNRKIEVMMDPFSALDALKTNTLTKDHVESLAYNYPKIYDSMRRRILETLAEDKETVPFSKRLSLSLLLGINGDPSLMNIQSYQDAFTGHGAAAAAQPENPGLNQKGLERLEPGTTYETPAQRMQRERPV